MKKIFLMVKVLIIGSGSIGKRHYRILNNMCNNVKIYSRREKQYKNLSECIKQFNPNYAVVATETSSHFNITSQLVSEKIPLILVEKPVFHKNNLNFDSKDSIIKVGYNMRFNPFLNLLKEKIKNQKIFSVQVYTGQYLPLWRPQEDYKNTYSTDINLGGGVLNDLSHELDYLQWLFGPCNSLVALGGHFSNLYGDSDDVFSLIMSFKKCKIVSVQLNYLHNPIQRELIVNTSQKTFQIDFSNKVFLENGIEIPVNDFERDFSYIEQHKDIITNNGSQTCSLSESINTLNLIDAARKSSKNNKWI
ncbi:MAG: oxidoreductase, partial [Rickettsiales bacterium]|nr:oxidoreductase [Rickettsiales bacterium]